MYNPRMAIDRKKFVYAVLTTAALFSGCGPSEDARTKAASDSITTAARTAAVAIPDSYGSQVAEDVLQAGGNAVDAAIAVGFSMAVTFIDAGNIGGGGFMLIQVDDESAFIDYREVAPLAASKDMYLDENGDVIENASLIGGQAAGVPGTVAGFWEAHQRFGKLPWKDLLKPAVDLAENGFLPAEILVDDIHGMEDWFEGDTNFFYGTAVPAHGVLYIASRNQLFALAIE